MKFDGEKELPDVGKISRMTDEGIEIFNYPHFSIYLESEKIKDFLSQKPSATEKLGYIRASIDDVMYAITDPRVVAGFLKAFYAHYEHFGEEGFEENARGKEIHVMDMEEAKKYLNGHEVTPDVYAWLTDIQAGKNERPIIRTGHLPKKVA